MADDQLTRALQAIIAVVVVAAFAFPLLGQIGVIESGDAEINPETDAPVTVEQTVQTIPQTVGVDSTTENAIYINGSGHVAADTTDSLDNGSWTVCANGELSDKANEKATATLYAYDNESILLQYDAGNWLAYADNGTHDGIARMNATAPKSGFRAVCGRFNATTGSVSVSRMDTVSAPVQLTASTSARNVSVDWLGRIDEVREFNSSLSNSTLREYANHPVRPQPGTDRVSRIMFEEGSGTTATVYVADISATIVDGTWTAGLPDPKLSQGQDYTLADDPFSLVAESGGELDGAPVAYVSWSQHPLGLPVSLAEMIFAIIGIVLIWNVLLKA